MAMDQTERDRRRREKAAKHQEEDLRLKVRPGTNTGPTGTDGVGRDRGTRRGHDADDSSPA
jgi:hypothetical protein